MATFTVTSSNWNDASFWSAIDVSETGQELDFSTLPSSFNVDVDDFFGAITISDGSSWFVVSDSSSGVVSDASLGGDSLLTHFTSVQGTEGDDQIEGGAQDDTLAGAEGDDVLEGGSGEDQISGGAGADTIQGGAGSDNILGGDGDDVIVAGQNLSTQLDVANGDFEGTAVSEERWTGNIADWDRSGSSGTHELNSRFVDGEHDDSQMAYISNGSISTTLTETYSSAETYELKVDVGMRSDYGTPANFTANVYAGDTLIGTLTDTAPAPGTYETYSLKTYVFDSAHDGQNLRIEIVHNSGHQMALDNVQMFKLGPEAAYADDDTVAAGEGDDLIEGGKGNDSLAGDGGDDTLEGGEGDDMLDGGAGIDSAIYNGSLADYAFALDGDGNLVISGPEGADTLIGVENIAIGDKTFAVTFNADGSVTMDDDAHSEVSILLGGDDTIAAGFGDDAFDGGAGDNVATFSAVNSAYTFSVNDQGALVVSGADGTDTFKNVSTLQFYDTTQTVAYNPDGTVTITDAEGAVETYHSAGSVQASGTSGADNIVSGAQDDNLAAGDGDDTVNAGAGDDSVSGGAGADALTGGVGADTLDGGAGDDTLTGGTGEDSLTGGEGSDTAVFSGSFDAYAYGYSDSGALVVSGPDGSDTLTGIETLKFSDVTLSLTETADGTFLLTDGQDTRVILSGEGDDTISADASTRFVEGAGGADTVVFSGNSTDHAFEMNAAGHLEVTGPQGSVTLSDVEALQFDYGTLTLTDNGDGTVALTTLDGGARTLSTDGAQSYEGTADPNNFIAGGGADTISSGEGDDTVIGGAGNDAIDAGAGNDTALFSGDGSAYRFGLTGDGAVTVTGPDGTDTLTGVETLQFDDQSVAFTDNGDGTASLMRQDGVTTQLTADGSVTSLSNTTTGTTAGDQISGSDHADSIDAGAGDDTIDTGAGVDTVSGGEGNDSIIGGGNSESLSGDAGDDTILGGNGNDTILGGDGDDFIDGQKHRDSIDGGAGNDTLIGGHERDVISGGSGDDRISGGHHHDNLAGGDGNDTISGGDHNDTLDGGTGDDVMAGGAGIDSIDGGAGDDTLIGGTANDTLDGGEGSDIAIFSGSAATYSFAMNADGALVVSGEDGAADVLTNIERLEFDDTTLDVTDNGDGTMSLSDGSALDISLLGATDDTASVGAGDFVNAGDGSDTAVFSGNIADFEFAAAQHDISQDFRSELEVTGADGVVKVANVETLQFDDGAISVSYGASGSLTLTGPDGVATTLHSDGTITTLGSSAADSLSGGTAADTLSAGDADDVITGGTGDDSIDGGSGTDTAVFSGSLSDYGLSVDLDTGDLLVSGPDGQDRLTDVETLQFGDTAYAVQVAGSEITLPSGPDDIARFTPDGSGLLDIGDDTSLFGGVGDEVLSGGADDDGLAGGAGADTLVGDGGDDTLQGGAGGDLLSGGAGNDSILGDGAGGSTDSVNLLVNGSFEDGAQGLGRVDGWEISGGPGGAFRSATRSTDGEDAFALGGWANAVGSNLSQDVSLQSGEAYTLTFDIGATTGGDDQVVRIEMLHADGTALSETMTIPKGAVESFKFSFVAPSDDMTVRFVHVDGESGDADLDNVVLRPVSDNNRDTIDAGAGDDFVDGGADNDSIEGGAGADTLRGGDNDDTLIGGADDDNLDGGAGSDTAVLSGNAADYAFSVNGAGALVVSGQDGTDTLSNIQTLQFDDTSGAVEYHPDGSVSISTGDAPATLYTSDGPVAHLIARETFDENNGSGWYTTAPNAEGNLTLYTAGGRTADGDRYFGNRMGDDGTEFVNKTYDLSGTSSDDTLIIEFDFYAFDTRDALSPDDLSDQMHIFVNGAELTAITPSTAGDNQSGTFNGGSWEIVRAQHDDNLGFGGGGDDVYQVRIVMDNPGDSVQLGFGGSVANSHHSEIWGIDNLTVATSDDPIFSFSQNDTDVTPVATAGAVVMGNHFDDSIVAAADASESVEGGDGNDTLRSSSGSDTLDGGAGDDVLNTRGGAQGDEARGGEGDDSIIGSVRDTLIGGDGDDTVVFQSWANDGSAFGEAGDDSILGNNGQQYISGGDGNDTISGGGEYDTHDSDTLVGGAGDDSISSGNTLTPRDGFAAFGDSLRGDEGDDTLIGGAAKDTLDGGADNDSLDAGAEDDLVRDGMGDDTVDGGTGDDSIIAGGGLDQYAGGSGEDLIDYSGTSTVLGDDGVRINLESQTVSGGEAADDTISGFEHATGSGSDDTILGSAGDNVLSGSAGNDSIYGGAGRDFLDGGTGQDTLVISDNDTAMGGEGDDTITTDAWAVNSRAFGGDGNDSMIGINGWNQVFFGEGGDDTLSGGQEAGTGDVTYLYGGDGNDLVSSGFTNATTGQMAKAGDHLTGDAGDDTLLGGAARDVLSGGADQDSIDGAQGNDTIDGGSGDDTITGGIGDDVIGGGAGADSIDAGDGDDRVYLGDGGDTVLGGAGNDLITGAQGAPVHGNSITFNSTGGEGLSTGYGVAGDMQDFPTTALTYEVTFSSEQEHAVLGSYQSDSDASNHMILMAHSSTNTFWGFINGEIVDTGVDTTPFFDGEIHTVGMSWDSATGDFQLYGDGAALFQGTVSAGTPLPADGTFVLGQEQDVEGGAFNTAEIFQGEVFGVRLYDDVRSPGEMAGSSLTPTAPADANLIANWVPDAGTEGMIDTTGNHPMALNGDVAFTDAAAQSGDDSINAGDGDDTIDGGTGDDVINAGEGDDYVYVTGDFGNDTVSLGTGQDTVDMSGVSDGVTVDYLGSGDFTFTDGQDTIALNDQSGQPVGTFILTDQEDIYDGGGGGTFHMGDGDDTITGGLHHGLTAYGEEGDDALTGNASGDMLDGGDGDDTLSGGFGADTLIGGTGDDSIAGGDGADFLKTGQGQDTLDGGAGADTLMNAAGDDSLVGGGGDDLIVATQGQDTLEGDAGSDTLMGGTDGDSIDGGADNDLILGDLAGVKFNETGTDGAAIASGISDFPSSQLTYEITFSSTDTTGETPLASYAAPGKDNEFLLNVQSGTLTIGLNDSAYADTGITSASLFDGSVKTLAVTWDNATGDLEIFVDGSPAYTGTLAQNETLTQGGSFALGQEQDSPGGSFDNVQVFEGTIYGVRLYNDIRTSSEILDSVHGPVADTSDPSLIANWVADADGPGFTDQTGSYTMAVAGDVVQDWSAGTDTIQGGAGDDTVYAGGGGDTISSGSGNDSVEGGDDADTFIIEDGFGNDTITGGEDGDNSDQDLIDLSGVTASGVTVNFSGDEAGTVTDGTDTIDFSEIEQISGTDQGDKIDAGNATSAVTLEGAGGNDVVLGGDGADSIDGGDGNDNLSGDAGADTIDGGAGFDYVNYGSTHSNDLSINLRTGANTDGDTYINLEGAQGGSGADTIIGTDGDESFLSGYSGADSIDAGDGDDLIWGDHNAFSTAGGGADTILAGSGKDTVFGHSGDDLIYGGEGDDSLSGGQGTDTIVLENASGSDTIIGGEDGDGSDIDVIDLSSITAGAVTVTYTGQEAGTIVVGSDTISFSEIEEIILTDHADVVDATGAALTSGINMDAQGGDDSVVGTDFGDTIAGGEGNDLIEGGLGDDLLTTGLGDDTLLGGEGNDTLMNSDGDDSLDGGAGDDSIVATGGEDTLRGGTGDDTMDGGDDADTFIIEDGFGNDVITGGEGTTDASDQDFDTIDLSAITSGPVTVTYTGAEAGTITDGTDTITFSEIERIITTDQADIVDASGQPGTTGIDVETGGGDDTVTGSNNADRVDAGDGNDSVTGGSGWDTLTGGAGNDTMTGDGGSDRLEGGTGDDSLDGGGNGDRLIGGEGNDTLAGGAGFDTLEGGADDDSLDGGSASDSLDGGDGADTLIGGTGDDTLEGGAGDDLLTGGDGDDTFIFNVGDGADTITDFNAGNTGALGDGDTTNNDFIDLGQFYSSMGELRADFDDDGLLNQSNDGVDGADYSDNTAMQSGDSLAFSGADRNSFSSDNTGVVCFAAGTLILTDRGEVPVERLRAGDRIATYDNGFQPLAMLASRRLGSDALAANPRLEPIEIKAGALGFERSLIVSPQHAMLVRHCGGEALVRARQLSRVKGGLVRVMKGCRLVTYVHLIFDAHQIVFANGRPAESFYPGPRALDALSKDARQEFMSLFPNVAAEVARTGAQAKFEAARKLMRSRELPSQVTTAGPAHSLGPLLS